MGLTEASAFKDGKIINDDINASAAIAKSKLASLDIVNADVNSSAAIAGTKISPNFGTQVIQTKASAVNTNMFKITRQDHNTEPLFRIFQDSGFGGGTGGCHINSNNRPLLISAKSAPNTVPTSGLCLMNTGFLGLGVTDPDAKLHIKNGNILLESTDAGSSVGPTLDLFRNSPSPADSDDIGRVLFRGEDSAGGTNTYATIVAQIDDATNNTEDGSLEFSLRKAGSTVPIAQLTGTSFNIQNGTNLNVTGNLSVTGTTTLPNQGQGLVPVGTVITFAGSTPPTGYLKANGDTIPNGTGTVQSITADFSALHAIVGATLPDLRGEFVRGWADNRNVDAGRTIRSSQSDLIESHRHWISRAAGPDDANMSGTDGSPAQEYGLFADAGGSNINDDNSYPLGRFTRLDPQTQDNGNGNLHAETRPRNVALLMCIKY